MSGDAMLIQEVATRDGFQIEPVFVETADKIALIDALSAAGFSRIEVSSFVSPKAVPALRDAADVPAGRIYSVADIVADPHYAARDMILEAELPGGTTVKMPGIVPKLSGTPGSVRWQGPALGAHTDDVLADLGRDSETIARLRREGAVQ